jgi:uncharacterized protein (DUF4415 family)
MKKHLTNLSGDVRELTSHDIAKMKSAEEVLPATLLDVLPKRKRGQRGMQKNPTKLSLTMRYSPEVVLYFKSTGLGWQTRIDRALQEWIHQHPRAA